MILYNWEVVYKKSKGRIIEVLRIIHYITYRPIPQNEKSKLYKYSQINWAGKSFIVHPEAIFENMKEYSKRELAEYVGLASYRNYAEYKVTRKTTLNLLQSPLKEEALNNNRLVTLVGNEIHFKWEDTEKPNGSI